MSAHYYWVLVFLAHLNLRLGIFYYFFVCEIIRVYFMHIEKNVHTTTYKIIRHSLGRFSGLNFIRGIVRGVAKATPIFRDL